MIQNKFKIYILGIHQNFRGENLYDFLNQQNFDVEIFWGYTSKDIEELRLFSDVQKSEFLYGRSLTLPEIACSLGHRKILEKAFTEDLDSVLILEDDVVINDPKWLTSQIEISTSSSHPRLTILITDSRLSLTKRPFFHKLKSDSQVKIYSNPSPSAAYLFNRAALNKIRSFPESDWHGTQADFPPILSRELNLVDASNVVQPFPIALTQVGSTMSSQRKKDKSPLKYAMWYFHKILFLGYFQGRTYGMDLKTYFYHFIGRRIAWKVSKDTIPIQHC